MDEHEWLDKLQKEKVQELSLHPRALTRFEKELELELPDIDFKEDEKKDDTRTDAPTSSATNTITITIGGIAVGVVAGVGATTLMNPSPVCPAPTAPTSSQTSTTGAIPPRTAGATSVSPTSVPGAR